MVRLDGNCPVSPKAVILVLYSASHTYTHVPAAHSAVRLMHTLTTALTHVAMGVTEAPAAFIQ